MLRSCHVNGNRIVIRRPLGRCCVYSCHALKFQVLAIVVTLLVAFVPSSLVYAQVAGATLSGSITDSSGAALVGAEVSIKNSAAGVIRAVTSDSAGFYTAPNLVPGEYRVTVVARGFGTSVAHVTLTVGANQRLAMRINVGGRSATIEVNTQAPPVHLSPSYLTPPLNQPPP